MDKIQDSVVLKRLLANPDFKMFMKEISSHYIHVDEIIKNIVKQRIPETELAKLNYHIAERNALGSVLISENAIEEDLESLIDELSEDKE